MLSITRPISSSTEPGEFMDVDLDGGGRRTGARRWIYEGTRDTEEEENDQNRITAAREISSSTVMNIEESEGISLQALDFLDLLSDDLTSRTLAVHKARPRTSKKNELASGTEGCSGLNLIKL